MKILVRIGLLLMIFTVSPAAQGMNLLMKPYDTLIRPEFYLSKKFEIAGWLEQGVKNASGFNSDGSANVLALWNADQDALAMLDGFPVDSRIGQLRLVLNAPDDGVRGHFTVNGKLSLRAGAIMGMRWQVCPNLWLVSYLPYYRMSLHDVGWTNLTQSLTPDDQRVQQFLTNDFFANVNTLGDGLQLTGWHRNGVGDLNVVGEWLNSYEQSRPLLKEVTLNARAGFMMPTGLTSNPNQIFSVPFGNDGAWGILFGGGLWVTLGCWFKTGFDVQLSHTFGNTRVRRIKTSADQTELLLLAKVPAYKDFGLLQRFNLFIETYQFYKGLSATVGYQMLKQGDSSLALGTCDYSSAVANTAQSLEEWTAHSIEANLHYDFNVKLDDDVMWPQAALFVRWPFNGKRAALFTTVGFYIGLDF